MDGHIARAADDSDAHQAQVSCTILSLSPARSIGALLTSLLAACHSIMAVSLCCSIAQCAHFWLLEEQSGLNGQAVMLAMSVLGYYDSVPAAQRAYWLLDPVLRVMAGLQQVGAPGSKKGGLLELLPLVAALTSVVARQQRDLLRLRLGTLLSAVPWLPYCVAVGSWSNFVGMLVFMLLSTAALLRFHVFATLSDKEQWRLTHGTFVGLWLSPVPNAANQGTQWFSGDGSTLSHLHSV